MSENGILCERCSRFDIQSFFQDGDYISRGYQLEDILDAVDNSNCSFCSLLLEYVVLANKEPNRHLSLAMQNRKQQVFALSCVSWMRKILLFISEGRSWVHFYVTRDVGTAEEEARPLRIKQIVALVMGSTAYESPQSFFQNPRSPWVERLTAGRGRVFFNIAADPDTEAFVSGDVVGRIHADESTWTRRNIESILSWHASCCNEHTRCRKTLSQGESLDPEKSPLPTRCLEVRASCDHREYCACPLTCILRETGGQEGRYIALSHRWCPETLKVRTVQKNYKCRIRSCTGCRSCWSGAVVLPRAFRDAGALALQLGVKYIWIDSLSIVQDDVADWEREAVKMASYYQNAWLTIAATTTGAGGELFAEVDTKALPRVSRLPYRDKNGEPRGHFYVQCSGDMAVWNEYESFVTGSDLLKRGWVLQEWILSRRVLTFTNTGIFMQCQVGPPQSIVGDKVLATWGHTKQKEPQLETSLSLAHVFAEWRSLVERYSGLQLTRLNSDRLVALSGLASEFDKTLEAVEGRIQDEHLLEGRGRICHYVAGLWFPDLGGLCWERVWPGLTGRVCGIPTWSWASTKVYDEERREYCGMKVQWRTHGGNDKPTEVCKLLSAHVVPVVNTDTSTDVWVPKFDCANDVLQADQKYDNSQRFYILELSGYLQLVQIHDYFDDSNELEATAQLTGHDTNPGKDTWRRVTVNDISPYVIGWASLENPDNQDSDSLNQGGPLYALFLTRIELTNQGFAIGNSMGSNPIAYIVLYLRPTEVPGYGNSFERIGIGRMFGTGLASLCDSLVEHKVWLV